MNKEKFYQTLWFMWLMLIFIAPVGIFLMYKNKRYQPKTRKILTGIFAIWFIFMCNSLNSSSLIENQTTKAPINQTTNTQQEKINEQPTNISKSDSTGLIDPNTNTQETPSIPQQNIANVQQTNNDNEQVVVTPTGKKYHIAGCRTLSRSKILTTITVKEAKEQGYEPCAVCNPPQ